MKKFIASALIAASLISPAFAFDGKAVHGAKNEVLYIWHDSHNTNDAIIQSFFDQDGALIGTLRHADLSALPTAAVKTIQTRYKDYVVKEAAVLVKTGQSNTFYATLVSSHRILTVEIALNGDVSVVNTQW